MLVDHEIRDYIARGHLLVEPFVSENLGPASLDLVLSEHPFLSPETGRELPTRRLMPNQFALASTAERFSFRGRVAGDLAGRSSWGRRGLLVHVTAGFFDPGFDGYPTLELLNVSAVPIDLDPGVRIAQMRFHALAALPDRPYGTPGLRSKYQHQPAGPQAARLDRDSDALASADHAG